MVGDEKERRRKLGEEEEKIWYKKRIGTKERKESRCNSLYLNLAFFSHSSLFLSFCLLFFSLLSFSLICPENFSCLFSFFPSCCLLSFHIVNQKGKIRMDDGKKKKEKRGGKKEGKKMMEGAQWKM